ncbi:hypothetical protein [Thiopseudomonas denitrificans]|uniref:EF-hand domain-containing protein n=1 Tax=Thiopseudomonas denitrificans TaxID=1501432 RepID=A0A4R6TXF2_9GAMM|nr:hypothetical protein [Thiopseudomonas denitrificans]TDQ34185.1 hypothetical protein DFQ45_1204 [Thiopseudomonas denitrificans]
MSEQPHKWRFFRAGDFEQPLLKNAADLAALRQLDQKLWATLACPTDRLNISHKFLQLMDENGDARIRAPEVLNAIDWTLARLNDPDCLFTQRPLTLADLKDGADSHSLILAARRLLSLLGRNEEDSLTADDTADPAVIFPPDVANGDGLVPAQLTGDESLQALIGQIIECLGEQTDRSGEPGVSAEQVTEFFAQVNTVREWHQSASAEVSEPFGDATANTIEVLERVKDKINDYFTRVELVAYDARSATIMAADEDELARLGAGSLARLDCLKDLPLANLEQTGGLHFCQGINPAWQADVQAFRAQVVVPLYGDIQLLERSQWQSILDKAAAYFAWQADRPAVALLEQLPLDTVLAINCQQEEALTALIASDLEVEEAAQGWVDLDKLLNMQQYLVPLLKNFVSFEDFYGNREKAIFQAGRLFIDGKSCDLVIDVADVEAHSAVATQSNSFLIYCHCVRRGQPVDGREECNIVALVSAGVDHELMPGRNGLFYDRDGNDWDATVVKVIENAISVREAFWSPYRRIATLISDQIQKFAAGQDDKLIASAAERVENGTTAAPFDIAKFAGIFAAIGLAVGALGTALAAAFSGLLALHWWQWPLVIIGLIVVVSGPSMLMAWFKLRRRSLGPILDANGWAVNAQARISINFGTRLTQTASLPKGSGSLRDPYARKSPLRWIVPLIALVLAGAAWYFVAGPGTTLLKPDGPAVTGQVDKPATPPVITEEIAEE